MARSWYFRDALNQEHGPFTPAEIADRDLAPDTPVWRPEAEGWVPFWDAYDLLAAIEGAARRKRLRDAGLDSDGQPRERRINARQNIAKATDELLGIAKGILVDGDVIESEVAYLNRWCEEHREFLVWPIREVSERLRAIYADGVVTEEERRDLQDLLARMAGGPPTADDTTTKATRLPLTDPAPDIAFPGRSFCITGSFVYGSRKRVEGAIEERGGALQTNTTTATNYVVIGAVASRDWRFGAFGTKIEKAVAFCDKGQPIAIVAEEHWVKYL